MVEPLDPFEGEDDPNDADNSNDGDLGLEVLTWRLGLGLGLVFGALGALLYFGLRGVP